jgi:hypothetical protein
MYRTLKKIECVSQVSYVHQLAWLVSVNFPSRYKGLRKVLLSHTVTAVK